jgi:RNA polymerase primary sigma factor
MSKPTEFEDVAHLKRLQLPYLGREEERALALRAKRGDKAASERLIRSNIALVLSVVAKMRDKGLRLEDLVQEGLRGLARAIDGFEPERGLRFSTYAVWWIRAYSRRALRSRSLVHRPPSVQTVLYDRYLDEPVVTAGGSITGNGQETTHKDLLVWEGEGQSERALRMDFAASIRSRLDLYGPRLGKLGREIVERRLMSDAPETLEEIGERFDLSRERVRQVEGQVKKFLRRALADLRAEEVA